MLTSRTTLVLHFPAVLVQAFLPPYRHYVHHGTTRRLATVADDVLDLMKGELSDVKKKMADIEDKRNKLLDKTDLTRQEASQLAAWKEDLDKLSLDKANCYRALSGKKILQREESKSFSELKETKDDLEHLFLTTDVDLRSSDPCGLAFWPWPDPPERDFPEDVLDFDALVERWTTHSSITAFWTETSHRILIDDVVTEVVRCFDSELVVAYERTVAVSSQDEGTRRVLKGDLDYTVLFDEFKKLAAGRTDSAPADGAVLNLVAVEAKKLDSINQGLLQLVAATCALRKLRAEQGRGGVIYGVLSNASKWLFIQIDDDGKLRVSNAIIVGLGPPVRENLRRICRTLYAILHEGLEAEKHHLRSGKSGS